MYSAAWDHIQHPDAHGTKATLAIDSGSTANARTSGIVAAMLRAIAIATLLLACGGKSKPKPPDDQGPGTGALPQESLCIKTGCSGTVCAENGNDVVTTCEFKPEYACYKDAVCTKQADGKCGWTQNDALKACLANPPKS